MTNATIFCLMGPTASGKTPLAIELCQRYPFEIVSVDSALIYRGMDIGTAKPSAALLRQYPHHLIDLLDPKESYSAGLFVQDALQAIALIQQRGKIPLLVGGTMMYFRMLQQGIAALPTACTDIRLMLQERTKQFGLPVLHAELAKVDPVSAAQIKNTDTQRIQRALEVYYLSGKKLSELKQQVAPPLRLPFCNMIINPTLRSELHARIATRLTEMLGQGFVDEVLQLHQRGDLHQDLPAMRMIGYRQALRYLNNEISYTEMCTKILAATRQLAKRQLTWLKPWPKATWFTNSPDVLTFVERQLG